MPTAKFLFHEPVDKIFLAYTLLHNGFVSNDDENNCEQRIFLLLPFPILFKSIVHMHLPTLLFQSDQLL